MSGLTKIAFDGLEAETLEIIEKIVAEHAQHIEIVLKKSEANLVLSAGDMPEFPIKIGVLLDKIESAVFHKYQDRPMVYGNYTLNYAANQLTIDGKDYELSERERDLMSELIIAGDHGCSRDYLLKAIWGYRADLDTHALETQIYRLRRKIEQQPDDPKYLVTFEGGYRLS